MKKCNFCGNKHFQFLETDYTYKHSGKYLIINNVPCKQCEYCGEQYFEAKVLKQIEQEFNDVTSGKKQITTHLSIPTESFKELASA